MKRDREVLKTLIKEHSIIKAKKFFTHCALSQKEALDIVEDANTVWYNYRDKLFKVYKGTEYYEFLLEKPQEARIYRKTKLPKNDWEHDPSYLAKAQWEKENSFSDQGVNYDYEIQ